MSYLEFLSRRKSSKYKVGDRVYFEDVKGWNDNGLPVHVVRYGIVVDTDGYFYIVESAGCIHDIIARDMRKLRKNESPA